MKFDKLLRTLVFNKGGRTLTVGGVKTGAKIVAPNSGRDPLSLSKVGCREGLTPGHFRVRLRYASADEARQALQKAPIQQEDEGVFVAHLDVPVIHRVHYETENLPARNSLGLVNQQRRAGRADLPSSICVTTLDDSLAHQCRVTVPVSRRR